MTGRKSRRVAFTFDALSLNTLREMTENGQYSSMGDCVRESLQINRVLQLQARKGYTELIMRKPGTCMEKVIVIPRLQLIKEACHDL